jgi:hypothetical protein
MERKEKAREKQMKVQLPEIEQDWSPGKHISHTRLLALVSQLKFKGIVRLYKKKELQKLCSAYGCCYLAKWNKVKLADELCQVGPCCNIIRVTCGFFSWYQVDYGTLLIYRSFKNISVLYF